MNIAIIIPARYGSSRFPGKPLAKIGGQTMLSRVVDLARGVATQHKNIDVLVTTEDQSIAAHCKEIDVVCVITAADCATGSDRVLAALNKIDKRYDFVINLQGDAPFTPPEVIEALIETFLDNPEINVVTPVHQLGWDDLDRLREAKKITPFSGTTVTINAGGQALWFSKNIIPAIRKEDRSAAHSPIYQHMGVYGYRTDMLEKFCALPQSHYEQLEGLEQLRLLENGIAIQTVKIELDSGLIQTGIDTPEDLERAEKLLS